MDKTPLDILIDIYRSGQFPMADSREADEVYIYDPPARGQLSITDLHIPAKLRKKLLKYPYDIRVDTDFVGVIDGCAETNAARDNTWINQTIRDLFIALHESNHPGAKAHSVECWQDGKLVGGLYGLAMGSVFCGESMFSRATDASKIALIHLCARLWKGGFTVLDTQFVNDHLKQFGVYEIPRDEYLKNLETALNQKADFDLPGQSERELVSEYLEFRKQKT
jgi:leucyl/phenylalanyl-tRNA--protein transferase